MPLVFSGGMLAIIILGVPLIGGELKVYVRVLGGVLAAIMLLSLSLDGLMVAFEIPRLVAAYRAGEYRVVEGCLSGFHPSTSEGHTPDVIRVGGHVFSYSDNIDARGFHETEISGGPIHADTWVRLFVVGDQLFPVHGHIVRVDVAQRACPPARPFLGAAIVASTRPGRGLGAEALTARPVSASAWPQQGLSRRRRSSSAAEGAARAPGPPMPTAPRNARPGPASQVRLCRRAGRSASTGSR